MSENPASFASVIGGTCELRFEPVRVEFERNFAERRDIGAAVCVVHEGRKVVDLWGGLADTESANPWAEDTMVVVHSGTKAATALCAHILASRRELDLDKPVTHYWPQFRQNGKSGVTVRMLLNHQAGLPGVEEPLALEDLFDFDSRVECLERQHPLWEPGTRHGYHAMTFGWLVGEIVRRVSGESVGTFFRRMVAEPLGIDFWIGLPAAEEHRVATTVVVTRGRDYFCLMEEFRNALEQRRLIQVALVNSFGGFLDPGACDAPGSHAAEIPAVNGITSARGLAGMYAPLSVGGQLGNVTLVDEDELVAMGAVESCSAHDACLFASSRFSSGFEKASYGRDAETVIGEDAFGHSGMGGCIGFADPGAKLAFGYVMNRHADATEHMNARYQPLIDATYLSLGYTSLMSGRWR